MNAIVPEDPRNTPFYLAECGTVALAKVFRSILGVRQSVYELKPMKTRNLPQNMRPVLTPSSSAYLRLLMKMYKEMQSERFPVYLMTNILEDHIILSTYSILVIIVMPRKGYNIGK